MAFEKHIHQELHNSDGQTIFYMDRSWNIQRPPYVHPMQFAMSKGENTGNAGPSMTPSLGPAAFGDSDALNRTYSKLTQATGDTATMLNNLHEARDSLSMITNVATSLIGAASALRRGDLPKVAKNLGIHPRQLDPRKLKTAKSFGDKWLQIHFGWVPLVQDIGAGLNVLNSDFGVRKVKSITKTPYSRHTRIDNGGGFTSLQDVSVSTSYRFQQSIRISNPNLFLANQMGVVNPLSVLWEAVPYSFVVDWFTNVGQCLSSMSDFVGLSIENPQSTFFQEGTSGDGYTNPYIAGGSLQLSTGKSVYVTRDLGVPGPTLELKPFKGFSPVRAATAISLLLQHL
uniref:Maturation n=1 Tax=Leviviridae sp. TaxID=2027243 RepID=A0A514DBC5_9VIRU|nr:MAG: hypothetical protein H2RhizoLitter7333_000003 [Leviviridae sp.]